MYVYFFLFLSEIETVSIKNKMKKFSHPFWLYSNLGFAFEKMYFLLKITLGWVKQNIF